MKKTTNTYSVGLPFGIRMHTDTIKNPLVIASLLFVGAAATIAISRNMKNKPMAPSAHKVSDSYAYLRAMVPHSKKLSDDDLNATVETANKLGIKPEYLLAVISFESATSFDPAKKNNTSGATGLIQFMPSTAKRLGTTTDALSRMTYKEQLEYVERYFDPWRNKLKRLEDVYAAVLWPTAIGRPLDYVLFSYPSIEYRQNYGLDPIGSGGPNKDADMASDKQWVGGNRKGFVTLDNAASSVRKHIKKDGATPDIRVAPAMPKSNAVLIGDSLAEGMSTFATKDGLKVDAKQGSTIKQWLSRTLPDVDGKTVLISLGTNDAATTTSATDIELDAAELVSKLIDYGAKRIVWLLPPYHTNVKRIKEIREILKKAILERDYSGNARLAIRDVAPTEGKAIDGIHYSPKGYGEWWDQVRDDIS